MHWSDFALVLYLFLTVLGMGAILAKHGEERTGKHNFWSSLVFNGLMVAFVLYLWWR